MIRCSLCAFGTEHQPKLKFWAFHGIQQKAQDGLSQCETLCKSVDFNHLVKVMCARFLHSTFTVFLSVINNLQGDTLRLYTYIFSLIKLSPLMLTFIEDFLIPLFFPQWEETPFSTFVYLYQFVDFIFTLTPVSAKIDM